MSVTMTLLILSNRIARGVTALFRPLRRSVADHRPAGLNVLMVPGMSLNRIDVEAMRRMW
jgi:hypothetical protein